MRTGGTRHDEPKPASAEANQFKEGRRALRSGRDNPEAKKCEGVKDQPQGFIG